MVNVKLVAAVVATIVVAAGAGSAAAMDDMLDSSNYGSGSYAGDSGSYTTTTNDSGDTVTTLTQTQVSPGTSFDDPSAFAPQTFDAGATNFSTPDLGSQGFTDNSLSTTMGTGFDNFSSPAIQQSAGWETMNIGTGMGSSGTFGTPDFTTNASGFQESTGWATMGAPGSAIGDAQTLTAPPVISNDFVEAAAAGETISAGYVSSGFSQPSFSSSPSTGFSGPAAAFTGTDPYQQ